MEAIDTNQLTREEAEKVVEFCREKLSHIIQLMNIQGEVSAHVREDGHIVLEIQNSSDLGILIGKEGSTLRALQTVLRVLVVKKFNKKAMLMLDADNYLMKREEALIDQAYAAVQRVERTCHKVQLRPMNSMERRIIHSTLANEDNIHTYSIGEGPDRRVVIAPGPRDDRDYADDYRERQPEPADHYQPASDQGDYAYTPKP
jgi:spoIIIJ-associated protein